MSVSLFYQARTSVSVQHRKGIRQLEEDSALPSHLLWPAPLLTIIKKNTKWQGETLIIESIKKRNFCRPISKPLTPSVFQLVGTHPWYLFLTSCNQCSELVRTQRLHTAYGPVVSNDYWTVWVADWIQKSASIPNFP